VLQHVYTAERMACFVRFERKLEREYVKERMRSESRCPTLLLRRIE